MNRGPSIMNFYNQNRSWTFLHLEPYLNLIKNAAGRPVSVYGAGETAAKFLYPPS